ncbi:PREDICTED: uncharacterized protein LOC105144709 [Acromyrmex echinatior]|uniref:uncharacterized protein LOC105144709 n=1 Tax=Acromyrmex echinatior TaxID=103372 RepID=UPI000580ECEA|nr:PREDICTED: uncharacterized protein LOC105144709 [Acromyrmex echinatior]
MSGCLNLAVYAGLAQFTHSINISGNNRRGWTTFTEFVTKKGIIGAIDGSHIHILKPKNNPNSYCNRKNYHSIFYTGEPGSIHDMRLFRKSNLYERIKNTSIDFLEDSHLDLAYKLSPHLLIGFKNIGTLTNREKNFNMKLSQCRDLPEEFVDEIELRSAREENEFPWESHTSDSTDLPDHDTLMDFIIKRTLTLKVTKPKVTKVFEDPLRIAKSHFTKRVADVPSYVLCKSRHNARRHTLLREVYITAKPADVSALTAVYQDDECKAILLAIARITVDDRHGDPYPVKDLIKDRKYLRGASPALTSAAIPRSNLNFRNRWFTFDGLPVAERCLSVLPPGSMELELPLSLLSCHVFRCIKEQLQHARLHGLIEGLQLTDPQFSAADPIELLVTEVCSIILQESLRKDDPHIPVAQYTLLGWILSGGCGESLNDSTSLLPVHRRPRADHACAMFLGAGKGIFNLSASPRQKNNDARKSLFELTAA